MCREDLVESWDSPGRRRAALALGIAALVVGVVSSLLPHYRYAIPATGVSFNGFEKSNWYVAATSQLVASWSVWIAATAAIQASSTRRSVEARALSAVFGSAALAASLFERRELDRQVDRWTSGHEVAQLGSGWYFLGVAVLLALAGAAIMPMSREELRHHGPAR